jgi:hypothetical protein
MKKGILNVLGIAAFLLLISGSLVESAVTPTAEVRDLSGDVLGTTPDQGTFPAEIGLLLQSGDTIETLLSSSATLALSEGSEIQLNESTKLDIEQLIQDQVTSARRSRVKLLAGQMQATLSAGHQKEGSAFTIETPNTLVGVKFSRPIVEVSYDPTSDTTIVDAHTVDVVVTNLKTLRELIVPSGSRVVVTGNDMSLSSIIRRNIVNTNLLTQAHDSVRQATSSTVPTSVGAVGTGGDGETSGSGAETSTNPSPGVRSNPPERQRKIVIINVDQK